MKVYIAARYDRREEMQDVYRRLEILGHECTSRWIVDGEDSNDEGWLAAAHKDVEDVERADAIMFFAEPGGSLNRGGGRYFELGLAFARSLRCIVVLPSGHETVFTQLPVMECYETVDEALGSLGVVR